MRRVLQLLAATAAVGVGRVWAQGIVTTAAGSDWIFPDDGRAALEARLAGTAALAVDGRGNTYLAERSLNQVLKIDARGVITVVAGNGLRRFGGDGGPGRAASLASPEGVALDAAGNVYIADTNNNRIRKVTPEGIITTMAGSGSFGFSGDGGPATRAALAFPASVVVDAAGSIYIADRNNSRIRRVSLDGIITTIAGTAEGGYSGDGGPAINARITMDGLALDAAGNLYIADEGGQRVRRVAPNGIITTVAGTGRPAFSGDGGPATSAALHRPVTVAVDARGNLFIADQLNQRVRRVSPAGIITTVAGNGRAGYSGDGGPAVEASLSRPYAVAVDGAANLFIGDWDNARIRRVSADGIISTVAGRGAFFGDNGPATDARLTLPEGIALDAAGNLYIAEREAQRVRKVTPEGIITTVAGNGRTGFSGDGGPAVNASLYDPSEVAVDSQGNLYIADHINNRVRRVSAARIITTVAGNGACCYSGDGGPATQAAIQAGTIAVDGVGNIYIAFMGPASLGRVRRISPAGIITTVAGTGEPGYSGDGGPATSARIGWPWRVAVDAAGNLYIADSLNHRVRKVDRNGIITTVAGNGEDGSGGDGGPATRAQLAYASGMAVDSAGNLYISQGNRIRRVDSGGTITAYAGSGREGFFGDGGSASTAAFAQIRGLAIDAAGNLYIADTSNNRVRLVQARASASIVLSQAGLTFLALAGGTAPPLQSFLVVNGSQGTLNWGVTATTLSGGPGWLAVSPASGSSAAGQAGPPVAVRVNPAGLAAGDYYGQVEVRSPAAPNSPQFVTVVLNVVTPGREAGVSVLPSGMIFTGSAGGASPAAQALTLTALATQPVSFAATPSFGEGRPWFAVQPPSGNIPPGQAARVEVRPNLSGFAGGVYDGVLTFVFGDNTVRLVRLLLVLSPGVAGGVAQAVCTPARLLPVFTSLGANFSVTAGWPAPIEVRVVDDCGRPMTAGAVVAGFSNGDPPVALASLQEGRWGGTWQGRSAGAGRATVTVEARSTAPELAGTALVEGDLRANPNPPPEVATGGVLHAASFARGFPLAPGSLVSIFGTRLAAGTTVATFLPLPPELGGTTAAIGGRALPLLFTSPNQVNAMIPFDLPINAMHQLLVRRGAALSVPETLFVLASQAGVFTKSATGRGEGIVVRAAPDGSQSVVGPDNPVQGGDALVVYCTGLGDVDPRTLAGAAAPLQPISNTLETVQVSIGGVAARVFFAGLTPGFTGLYQVNAFVPAGLAPGIDIPLVVTQSGRSSPPVAIAVR